MPDVPDRRLPVAMQVFSHLRELIIKLKLRPSEALSEKELSIRLGVSRTPVREALIRLADEGLVDIYPQRGTFVAPIRVAEVKEAQFIRDVLETAIVQRAAKQISAEFLYRLEGNLRRQELTVAQNDYDEFLKLDEDFHHTLSKSVTLPRAWKVIQTVKGQLDRVRYISFEQPGHIEEMRVQHKAIFAAIKRGNSQLAVREMRQHLHEVWRTIERLTKEKPEIFDP